MMAPQKKKSLPGQHHKTGVRDSAAEAVETAKAAKTAEATAAAKAAGTAKTAEAGEALPPNQPPDSTAPVTQAEFRETTLLMRGEFKGEIHKLDKRMEAGFSETDKKIGETKTELKDGIHDLRDDIHKSESKVLLIVVSILVGLVVAFATGGFGVGAK